MCMLSSIVEIQTDEWNVVRVIAEQEEELDDLAGEVSQLEGVKLKLEMEIARVKTDLNRELEVREEELEQSKQSYSKKVSCSFHHYHHILYHKRSSSSKKGLTVEVSDSPMHEY